MHFLDHPSPDSQPPAPEEITAELDRILRSPLFRNADMSRSLLTFLTTAALEGAEQPREWEIATKVFNRQPKTFDPQTDSVVRVQMARLRSRLRDYYDAEGSSDRLRFNIPKGSYSMVATVRPAPAPAAPGILSLLRKLFRPHDAGTRKLRPVLTSLAFLLLGLVIGLLWTRLTTPAPPRHLSHFWSQVLPGQNTNLIVFSNPRLAGTLYTDGLRYFNEETDGGIPGRENLTYTGAGDVPAVSGLIHLFDLLHREAHVRAGALLSWEQAREANLVFIGRPEQNPALRTLPRLTQFYFKYGRGIVDSHPPAGGRQFYGAGPRPYTRDWAIIAFVPGLSAGRKTLILAGDTTYGSEAAAEFVCNEAKVAELLSRLNVTPGAAIPYFETMIELQVNKDVPVWSRLLFVRKHETTDSSWQAPAADER